MEVVALSAPILLVASLLIYWHGRNSAPTGSLVVVRILVLGVLLAVWLWSWWTMPSSAFRAPLWHHVSYLPAAAAIAGFIALYARRYHAARR